LSRNDEIARRFYLAGGTALALHLGHRISKDVDLFCKELFNLELYSEQIVNMKGRLIEVKEGTIYALIKGVKVSFLYYPYKILRPLTGYKGLRVASIEDIACMKVIAISQRGEKKDFYDIYETLRHYSIEDIKALMIEKYPSEILNWYHIVKSFCYFDDAEKQADPLSLNNTRWEEVKTFFLSREKEFSRIFLSI